MTNLMLTGTLGRPFLARMARRVGVSQQIYDLARRIKVKPWQSREVAHYSLAKDSGQARKMSLWTLGLVFKGKQARLKLEVAKYLIEKGVVLPEEGPVEVAPQSTHSIRCKHEDADKYINFVGFAYQGRTYNFSSPLQIIAGS